MMVNLGVEDYHIVKKNELAGFDLVGWRRKDGKLALGVTDEETANKMGSSQIRDNFPKQATINDDFSIYELEEVKKQGDGLEWGIYG